MSTTIYLTLMRLLTLSTVTQQTVVVISTSCVLPFIFTSIKLDAGARAEEQLKESGMCVVAKLWNASGSYNYVIIS